MANISLKNSRIKDIYESSASNDAKQENLHEIIEKATRELRACDADIVHANLAKNTAYQNRLDESKNNGNAYNFAIVEQARIKSELANKVDRTEMNQDAWNDLYALKIAMRAAKVRVGDAEDAMDIALKLLNPDSFIKELQSKRLKMTELIRNANYYCRAIEDADLE